jgi:hypothetical protein
VCPDLGFGFGVAGGSLVRREPQAGDLRKQILLLRVLLFEIAQRVEDGLIIGLGLQGRVHRLHDRDLGAHVIEGHLIARRPALLIVSGLRVEALQAGTDALDQGITWIPRCAWIGGL